MNSYLMLADNSDFFHKVVPDIAGAMLNMCTFAHNHEPLMCSCGLNFGHKGQHECYDDKCPFTWIDNTEVNPEVITFEQALAYCSGMELKKQIALAEIK